LWLTVGGAGRAVEMARKLRLEFSGAEIGRHWGHLVSSAVRSVAVEKPGRVDPWHPWSRTSGADLVVFKLGLVRVHPWLLSHESKLAPPA
jgi:hypothetical protein